ncbi:MAG: potassium-transporting ATPase subunit C, partial [Acidobacteriia bacterium]|nr:potassium-transporting ATPase subunit C [Terriglobia bacterium]
SGSGLDPHVSPDSARAQAARVAKAHGTSTDEMNQLIAQFTEPPTPGIFGESRVNVLRLNLALDERWPKR